MKKIGLIDSPWRLADEEGIVSRFGIVSCFFTVAKHSIHDGILANKFLKVTETLTRFFLRLQKSVARHGSLTNKLCFLALQKSESAVESVASTLARLWTQVLISNSSLQSMLPSLVGRFSPVTSISYPRICRPYHRHHRRDSNWYRVFCL